MKIMFKGKRLGTGVIIKQENGKISYYYLSHRQLNNF